MPPWVLRIEGGAGTPNGGRRWIVRAVAVGAALLAGALAATPAQADNPAGAVPPAAAVGSPPTAGGVMTPPVNPVDTATPPGNGQPPPTSQQDNTATSTQTATAGGGAGGSATGGNTGSSPVGQGSHGGNAYANGGNADAYNSLPNGQSSRTGGNGSGARYGGTSAGGSDVFVLEPTKRRHSGRAAAQKSKPRPAGAPGPPSQPQRPGLTAPRGAESVAALSWDGGLPGQGGQLPGQNPFFSVLSGSGGSTAGLMLLLLAILGASIALPRDRFKPFRTPAVTWRPLAYVPPIELPG